ncbi:MAG: glycosyltransferase family 25 protein [Acidobacteriota bacterium]
MKIFVINLKESLKRRELMERQLQDLGLDYEIVEGINGHCLDDREQQELCDPESIHAHPDWLSPGAIGAALSHRLVWSRIAREGLESAVVLEDDVLLPQRLPTILRQIELHYGGDELLLLYWSSSIVQPFIRQSAVEIVDGHLLASTPNPNSLLSAVMYVIGSEVASKMVNINTPIKVTADHWVTHHQGQAFRHIKCLVPSPVNLANYPSDIRYGDQHLLRRIKRSLEARFWLIQQLSAKRRQSYFAKRQHYTWV